jgi:hypothetical protein
MGSLQIVDMFGKDAEANHGRELDRTLLNFRKYASILVNVAIKGLARGRQY